MSELELLPCPKCGLTGIHACMGEPLQFTGKLIATTTISGFKIHEVANELKQTIIALCECDPFYEDSERYKKQKAMLKEMGVEL